MKYFYIDNIKFNYILEFNSQNSKNFWKYNVSLIEYCETLGIKIPHYCYHKDLSIAGNCRMCLIELKKSPKPIVSCAMNAKSSLAANTEIFTNSPLVKKARENIMEFLLLNHPLDCPICDQGGDCDLQDQSLFFGITKKRFYNFKRIVTNKQLGPIVKTLMTRCIHCTRCVRFATEIAGIETLGVFGRGNKSEIGTYINKIFESELSGNIIDICPVGALTSKPYPFNARSWELKKINSIDFSDPFGNNIQLFLKNNKIIKILAGYTKQNSDNHSQWISNKTRFLFDGMFSSNKNINKLLISNCERMNGISSWNSLFKKLIIIIYLFDHLGRHILKINPFIVLFNDNISIEVISLLLLLEKKYSFFKLRKTNNVKIINDFELNLQTNNINNYNILTKTNLCLLIGTNTRYESPYLNLKIKKRFNKGNFQIFSINSRTNLTFPTISIGSNLKKLKSIIEGNSSICINFKTSSKILTILSTEILERKDAFGILNLFQSLNDSYLKKNWNIFNLLNTSLNSLGINYLRNFKNFSKNDLNKINGLILLGQNIKTSFITNKLMELQLLNYSFFNKSNIFLIEQNNKNNFLKMKNKINTANYIYLPTNHFFESFGSYLTTNGEFKQTVKIVSAIQATKNDWQILRKLISTLEKVEFTNNIKYNNRIIYNSKNLFNFRNLISFLFLNTKSLSKLSFSLKNQNQLFIPVERKKIKKNKILNSQIKKWIEDFYLGGYDNYSKESQTMISCSISLRSNTSTF